MVTALEVELASEQARFDELWQPTSGSSVGRLKMKLGTSFMQSGLKIADVVKSWGTDSKGRANGEISMVDFRKHVRKVITWENVKDIDGLFNEMDVNGSGALDRSELTRLLRKLQDEVNDVQTRSDIAQKRIDYVNERVEYVRSILATTCEAEQADRSLEAELGTTSIATRLGKEMVRKATKIADLVTSWDSTAGHMDRKQFRKNVRNYGIDGDDSSIDELFSSLDLDAGGTIDLNELRAAMTKLRDTAAESDKEVARLKKIVEASWKAAKAAQLEMRKKRKSEEAEAKAKEMQAELEAEAAKAAAEESRAAKEARALAKKQQEAGVKEAYEAKIAARRKSQVQSQVQGAK